MTPGAADRSIKIEGARFVLTMDPRRRIIEDGSVVVDGGRISRVGKADDLRGVAAGRVIDATEMVVTPGLVNGHIHVSYAHAVRGVFPDDLGQAYLPTVFSLQSVMTEEEEYWTSLLAITELLKYGTTSLMDPGSTKSLDACMEAYERSGCRIIVGSHVTDRPNPINLPVYRTDEAVTIMEETIERYDGRLDGRVSAWAMPFSSDYCSGELLTAAKGLADRYGTGLTLHQTNSPSSVEAHLREHGMRPVEFLHDIGVLGPNLLLSHVLGLDDAEVDLMARTGARAVACPAAALKSGAGQAAWSTVPRLLDAGVPVGLATDAANNSNLVETMRSVYLAAALHKHTEGGAAAVTAETALEMGTILGARSLGLDGEVGSVEAGKRADLVLFDTRRLEWRALFNPVNALVYAADGRSVHTVIVDGRVVVEDHKPLFVDEWELAQRVQSIGEEILRRTGVSFPPRWPVV